MNSEPQRRRSKRLATYDEADGDFEFSRGPKRSKKTNALEAVVEKEAAPAPAPAPVANSKRTREKSSQDEAKDAAPAKKPARRKMDFSTPTKPVEKPAKARDADRKAKAANDDPIAVSKTRTTRRTTRSSLENAQNGAEEDEDAIDMIGGASAPSKRSPASKPAAKRKKESAKAPQPQAVEELMHEPEAQEITRTPISDTSHTTSQVALPFSDTPVIDRNKALRKKDTKRRSSLGLRGRRASGLIDAGHTATPHSAVPPEDFYKHIEAEGLSEPRRMKQLLVWCGERALGGKPKMGESENAMLAARAIQEQLLKEFGGKSEMSDWFSREVKPERAKKVVRVKNPLNEGNEKRVKELEERIKRLKEEKAQLNALLKPPPAPKSSNNTITSPIDASLLPPDSAAILETLQSSSVIPSISSRLQALHLNLEFSVDSFATSIHALEQKKASMDELAESVLEKTKEALVEREKREKDKIGTGQLPTVEVLRALGRVMPGGGG